MNELTIKQELKDLEPSKAAQIEAVFAPMVEMLKGFEADYEQVMAMKQTKARSKEAKSLRVKISKIRIEADKVRKEQKAEYLRAGNAIQGVFNILKFAVVDKEDSLKEVERYYEILEEEKIRSLQAERELRLLKYDVDGSQIDLGGMEDQVWSNFLSGTKANWEAVKKAEEAAKKEQEEAERKKKEEDERIRKENEQLKIEREKAEKERRIAIEKARKEAEERQKEREEADRKLAIKEAALKAEEEKVKALRKAEEEKAEQKARESQSTNKMPDYQIISLWAKNLSLGIVKLDTKVAKDGIADIVKTMVMFSEKLRES